MATLNIPLDKLADAIGGDIEAHAGLIAAELAAQIIDRAPVDSDQLVDSIEISPDNPRPPKPVDKRRSAKPTGAYAGIKNRIKQREIDRAERAAKSGSTSAVWYITMRAPYGGEVNKGTPNQTRLKNQPRRVQRAAFAAMKRKAAQRGEPYPPYKKRDNKRDFFRASNRDISAAMRNAMKRMKNIRVKV